MPLLEMFANSLLLEAKVTLTSFLAKNLRESSDGFSLELLYALLLVPRL